MMAGMSYPRWAMVLLMLLVCGCAEKAPPIGQWFGPDAPAQVLLVPAPGTDGHARLAQTAHYKIFTTISDSDYVTRIGQLMEGSLTAYNTLAPGTRPSVTPLECYVFAKRFQWEEFTREHTGERAGLYLQINRGGYTLGDWYVAYDIGQDATLSVAAHEGWHQFVARHFRAGLPPFVEEGLATLFEGVQFKDGLPCFNLSINQNRAIELRTAIENNTLWPLEDVLGMNAGLVVGRPGPKIDAWYAQAWGLGRFLWDGDGGSHRAALQRMLADTADGTVYDPTGPHRNRLRNWNGASVKAMLEHYLQMDFDQINDAYQAYCRHIAFDELPVMSETP